MNDAKAVSYCPKKKLVNYNNQNVFKIDRSKNILETGIFSLSLVLCFFLGTKIQQATSISLLTFEEKLLIATAIPPFLFYGFILAKAMVKRSQAIAKYNREKPNLIKP